MPQCGGVSLGLTAEGISVGWVVARGCRVAHSDAGLLAEVEKVKGRAVGERELPERAERRAAVRNMLRHGSYKPTGRGKPASEYLVNAAAEGDFPSINNVVDINNLVSLEELLPISIVDLERAQTGEFLVRWGRPGESYTFNVSGQVLDLEDLLLLSKMPGDAPCATPIKDSQATKTHEGTQEVLGVLYAPLALRGAAAQGARRMAELLGAHCGAAAEWGALP
jgi:DNA/RNA-binding domain of Phe-tRNA-synthetase-like protein